MRRSIINLAVLGTLWYAITLPSATVQAHECSGGDCHHIQLEGGAHSCTENQSYTCWLNPSGIPEKWFCYEGDWTNFGQDPEFCN